jgi:hypothetical protein
MGSWITWFKDHSTAILATAVVIGKAGLLGKVISNLILGFATALGAV